MKTKFSFFFSFLFLFLLVFSFSSSVSAVVNPAHFPDFFMEYVDVVDINLTAMCTNCHSTSFYLRYIDPVSGSTIVLNMEESHENAYFSVLLSEYLNSVVVEINTFSTQLLNQEIEVFMAEAPYSSDAVRSFQFSITADVGYLWNGAIDSSDFDLSVDSDNDITYSFDIGEWYYGTSFNKYIFLAKYMNGTYAVNSLYKSVSTSFSSSCKDVDNLTFCVTFTPFSSPPYQPYGSFVLSITTHGAVHPDYYEIDITRACTYATELPFSAVANSFFYYESSPACPSLEFFNLTFNNLYDYPTSGQEFVDYSGVSEAVGSTFSGLYPSYLSISSGTRYVYVFVSMFLVAMIILFAVTKGFTGEVPSFSKWLIVMLEIGLFLFFVSIKYISLGVLIIIVLISLGLFFAKSRG